MPKFTPSMKAIEELLVEIDAETDKIDKAPADGLAGVSGSLAFEVEEIEKHFHNSELWYGKDPGDSLLLQDGLAPWTLTAGSGEAFGTELQLSDGTEIEGGSAIKKFDFRKIEIDTASQNSNVYLIQVWAGTGAFGAATVKTTVRFRSGTGACRGGPIIIMMPRLTCNNKLWMKLKCETDGATLDLAIGGHVYDA